MHHDRIQNPLISKDVLRNTWEDDISRLMLINCQDYITLQQSWADWKLSAELHRFYFFLDAAEGQGKEKKISRQKLKTSEHLKDDPPHFK